MIMHRCIINMSMFDMLISCIVASPTCSCIVASPACSCIVALQTLLEDRFLLSFTIHSVESPIPSKGSMAHLAAQHTRSTAVLSPFQCLTCKLSFQEQGSVGLSQTIEAAFTQLMRHSGKSKNINFRSLVWPWRPFWILRLVMFMINATVLMHQVGVLRVCIPHGRPFSILICEETMPLHS